MARRSFRHDHWGYSFVWWGFVFALIAGPLLTLGIEMSRYARAAGEVQKAVDLAALAAAREVDTEAFREEGVIRFLPTAESVAAEYLGHNSDLLEQYKISISLVNLSINSDTLEVQLIGSADASPLFPQWVPTVQINKLGLAQGKFR